MTDFLQLVEKNTAEIRRLLNLVTVDDLAFALSGLSAGVDVELAALVESFDAKLAAQTESGVYTPTLSNTTNIAGSTAYQCQFLRVGKLVHVAGRLDAQNTASGVFSLIGISLPIPVTFPDHISAGGVGAYQNSATTAMAIRSPTGGTGVEMVWVATTTVNNGIHFTFSYKLN